MNITDITNVWLIPLIILPGVGLLVISTSARYSRLHDEVHYVLHERTEMGDLMPMLLERGRLFRNALVALYLCIGLFALAGLVGVAVELDTQGHLTWAVLGITTGGIASLTFAATQLIRESIHSFDIIRSHVPEHWG